MCFKHYHAEEVSVGHKHTHGNGVVCCVRLLVRDQCSCVQVLMGRKMEDWLRFSVCYWHSFCGTGTVTAPGFTEWTYWSLSSHLKEMESFV